MATQMALPPAQHALASGAMQHADSDSKRAHVGAIASAAADDCGGHTARQDTGDESDAAHRAACAMCQTCHIVAVLQPAVVLAVAQFTPTSPPAIMHVFTSADRVLFLKPPIL